MFYKPEIRKSIRARRQQMDMISILKASTQIATKLIYVPKLIEGQHIGYYAPNEGEVDPRPIVECAEHQQKHFYLPVLPPGEQILVYYPHKNNEPLIANQFGILEPSIENKLPFAILNLDVILIPLVAFDKHCNRIGRGAGYYDRSLTFAKEPNLTKRPLLIGLAYEFQKIDEIVPASWDVPMDMIVTESNIYRHY